MITSVRPTDWTNLQNQVAQILFECQFKVRVTETFETVRGRVEIDVYAEESIKGRLHKIAVECKYWSTPVPQTVIHAFRTVVADLGVNTGYIVSKEGFQAGSFSAAELTNIRLVTWEEFQRDFEDTWMDNFFSPELARRTDDFTEEAGPLPTNWMKKLPEEGWQEVRALTSKYFQLVPLVISLTPYGRIISKDLPQLPLAADGGDRKLDAVPRSILEATGWREFLAKTAEYADEAVGEFMAIRDKYVGKPPE